MNRRTTTSGFVALSSILATVMLLWGANGQVGPCGPATVRGALCFYGGALTGVIAIGSTLTWLFVSFFSILRRNRTP